MRTNGETHITIPRHFDHLLRMHRKTHCSATLQYQGGHWKLTTKLQASPADLDRNMESVANFLGNARIS